MFGRRNCGSHSGLLTSPRVPHTRLSACTIATVFASAETHKKLAKIGLHGVLTRSPHEPLPDDHARGPSELGHMTAELRARGGPIVDGTALT